MTCDLCRICALYRFNQTVHKFKYTSRIAMLLQTIPWLIITQTTPQKLVQVLFIPFHTPTQPLINHAFPQTTRQANVIVLLATTRRATPYWNIIINAAEVSFFTVENQYIFSHTQKLAWYRHLLHWPVV